MRIALDATPLTLPTGGLRRYTLELAAALADRNDDDEILLVSDQAVELSERLRAFPNVKVAPPAFEALTNKWWSSGLPLTLLKNRVEIFHGTNFSVPYMPVTPSILTLHDLSPWKPSPIRPAGSERVRARTPNMLPLATRILTPTEAVRREAIDFFGLGKSRIRSIHHGCTALQPRAEWAASVSPYIAYVGDGGARKNIASLIAAWRLARQRRPSLQLVLVGPRGLPDEPGLRQIGRVADSEMATWLAAAQAFVYPSLYEGFGLPVLEAMSLGVPVIASRDPALVEVAGGCALHVPADSPERLSAAILRVTSDPDLADRLRADGLVRAGEFSWRRTARLTRELYVEAIDAW